MNSKRSLIAAVAALLIMPLAVFAENQEAIDDIVVTGKKSIAELRKDVYKAEEEFYAIYNDLNDEPEYDVRCFYERPTGTRIKNHVCRAKFVSKAYSSHGARNGNDLSRVANQDPNSALALKTAKYQEKMEKLVAENPDLAAAFIRYNDARVRFMAEREQQAAN